MGQPEMWGLDLSKLGDENEYVSVLVGGDAPVRHVQRAPAKVDERIGQVTSLRVGEQATDDEWEEYQRFKAWKASQGDAEIRRSSNQPIVLPGYERVVVDETPDMAPTGYPVGVNGKVYVIAPGVPVNVPKAVLEVLKNAVVSKPKIDERSRKIIGWIDVPRIPYRMAA